MKALLVPFCLLFLSTVGLAQPCTPAPSGMVAWWSGDTASTTTAEDITGNGWTATLEDNATAGVPGLVGGAFSFDGDGDVATTDLVLSAQGTIDSSVSFFL